MKIENESDMKESLKFLVSLLYNFYKKPVF